MNKTWTAIIVVIIVALGIWWVKNGSLLMPSLSTETVSPTAMASVSKAPAAGTAKKTATPAPQQLSYSQLVQQYGSNRIQFDANCQATPSSAVFKNGTSIMLDNRSGQARTITVGGQSYSVGAYGYQTITLSGTSFPQTLNVSCNNQTNVSVIKLQANISGQ